MKLYDINLYDMVQWSIVVGVVLFSALYMLGCVAPQWRVRLAQHLRQARYPHWINQLGVRIGGRAAGCGSCDTCGACATPNPSSKK